MRTILKIKNKIFVFFQNRYKGKQLSIEEKKQYIKSFGKPKDCFERSYFQFLCQKKEKPFIFKLIYAILNIPSFFLIIFFLIWPFKCKDNINKNTKEDAICMFDKNLNDRIPNVLLNNINDIKFLEKIKYNYTYSDKKFFINLWKNYPCSFNFLLKILLKIGVYRYYINQIKDAKLIITANEYSYTSSAMTEFCKINNLAHINVMHGESVFDLDKTFFCYDKCFVWDEFYIELYCKLGASKEQFIIAIPPCLKFDDILSSDKISYKYYLQSQTKIQMEEIKRLLESMTDNYIVRPHPLYTNLRILNDTFDKKVIENNDISIEESIMETTNIIAWDSTVLLQAYLNDKNAIIDDLSNPERNKFIEYGYIMNERAMRLSSMINKNKNYFAEQKSK